MSAHAELLKLLLPAVSYDKTGLALSAELEAEGNQLDQFESFLQALLDEVDPRTTTTLLPDWERVYGLPDACGGAGADATIEQRRAYLAAKVKDLGGLSKTYFQNLATLLGYTDTVISNYIPVNCESNCESGMYDDPWRLAWQVHLPHVTDNYSQFHADSACTDQVDSYLLGLLECVFMRLKPAHTFVIFTYQ